MCRHKSLTPGRVGHLELSCAELGCVCAADECEGAREDVALAYVVHPAVTLVLDLQYMQDIGGSATSTAIGWQQAACTAA
jgi:hypothetical protein